MRSVDVRLDSPGHARTLDGRDAWAAVLLGAAAWALYAATFQTRQYGDGPQLIQAFLESLEGRSRWGHVLYLPAARALDAVFDPASPVDALRLLSSLSAAAASACAYLLARDFGAGRRAALAAAGLLALSPGMWFFGTTIEVHALHVACVGVCALVTVHAPWRRPALAALLSAACLPLIFLSHQSGALLGPGFVLLAQWARVRSGAPPFRFAQVWLVLAPLYLSALLGALALAVTMEDKAFSSFVGHSQGLVSEYRRALELSTLVEGWLRPLGLLLPLALVALCAGRVRGLGLAVVLGLVTPSLAFFLLWGLPERGGYALPTALVLAALATAPAFGLRPRAALAAAPLALALQAWLAHASVVAYDTPSWRELVGGRVRAVAKLLPEGGVLISINPRTQTIEGELPRVREVSLYSALAGSVDEGRDAQEFLRRVEPELERLLAGHPGRLAYDREQRSLFVERAPHMLPWFDALDGWLAERCTFVEPEQADWPAVGLAVKSKP